MRAVAKMREGLTVVPDSLLKQRLELMVHELKSTSSPKSNHQALDNPEWAIKQVAEPLESFGDYNYEISRNGKTIAHYWQDYRGGEHGIIFLDNRKKESPTVILFDFVTGGGPEPLFLTDKAIQYLFSKFP